MAAQQVVDDLVQKYSLWVEQVRKTDVLEAKRPLSPEEVSDSRRIAAFWYEQMILALMIYDMHFPESSFERLTHLEELYGSGGTPKDKLLNTARSGEIFSMTR